MIVWSTGKISFKHAMKHMMVGCLLFVFYLTCRVLLTKTFSVADNTYMQFTLIRLLRNLGIMLGMTFYPIDYASLIHPFHRNLVLVTITGVLPAPFLWFVFRSFRLQKTIIVLLLSFFIGAFVNLITIFSTMHCYAVSPFAIIMIALLCDQIKNKRILIFSSVLYLITALFTFLHHTYAAWLSGKVGEQMAKSIVSQCDRPIKKVMIIHLNKGETKYSSFWVIPYEAFGWGYSVRQQTGYQWPKTIINEEITNQKQLISALQKAQKTDCDGVWYVENNQVSRIKWYDNILEIAPSHVFIILLVVIDMQKTSWSICGIIYCIYPNLFYFYLLSHLTFPITTCLSLHYNSEWHDRNDRKLFFNRKIKTNLKGWIPY